MSGSDNAGSERDLAGAAVLAVVLRNDIEEVAQLGEAVDEFCESHDLGLKISMNFNLALDEVLTNVISHGLPADEPHEIQVRIELSDGFLKATVSDDGIAFNPLLGPDPDVTLSVEDRPIGGLGIYLVRRLMDEVSYARQGDRNCLTFAKRVTE
jgi:anti-sigma regulatory factor (Ser/Thr protein kinase)